MSTGGTILLGVEIAAFAYAVCLIFTSIHHLRAEHIPREDVCIICGTTEELPSGDCKLCAERVVPQPTKEEQMTGAELIAAERERQVSEERWTPEHDDEHEHGELATAAVGYITGDRNKFPISWPFRPTTPVRDLTKAGALIAAEIDRLRRAS